MFHRTFIGLAVFLLFGTLSGPCMGYELSLDIDLDDDPTTINTFIESQSCTVRLVLAPTEPNEEIWTVDFGLGGSCHECNGVFAYGTDFDLGDAQGWTWEPHPWFAGTWNSATSIGCPASAGFHASFHAESTVDCCMVLTEPIFFGTFHAWVADNGPACNVPANLAVMHGQGAENVWNYIQIGGPAVTDGTHSWGVLKSSFR